LAGRKSFARIVAPYAAEWAAFVFLEPTQHVDPTPGPVNHP